MLDAVQPTVVATLGGQPQVVTFALDALAARGEQFGEVIVVHLSLAVPRYRAALECLAAEFPNDTYGGHACRFRPIPVRRGEARLAALREDADANAAWQTLYALIAALKAEGRTLHLCIAGGRRLLALMAMSAASLHFGHADRLWHLYTPDDLRARAANGALMHVRPEDGVRLVAVPMVAWGAYLPSVRALADASPSQIIAARSAWLDAGERARCRQVVTRLTRAQLRVLKAFAAGGTPQEVAARLKVEMTTINTHKTVIFDECRNAWQLGAEEWLDYRWLKEKFGAYFENE